MLDFELALVERFGWSLKDIDETDMESLLRFFFHAAKGKRTGGRPAARKRMFCDEAGWL